jgi:hypothetical protein
MSDAASYPVQLTFDAPYEMARWRPFVHWFLAIPQFIVLEFVQLLQQALNLIALVTVLLTKQIPEGIFAMLAMTHRYQWRVVSYAMFAHDQYPPFDFTTGATDDGTAPHSSMTFAYPSELQRWAPLYKWFIAIPHYVVLLFIGIGACFVSFAAAFAVLFTGRYPEGMRRYVVDVYRYGLRVQCYVGLMNDEYPPFTVKTA